MRNLSTLPRELEHPGHLENREKKPSDCKIDEEAFLRNY